MDSSSDCQLVLTKINDFYRVGMSDSDEKIKAALQDILRLWPDVLAADKIATDDELFALNVSRAVLTQVFSIALSKDFFYRDNSLVRESFFSLFNILVDYTNVFKESSSPFIDSNIRLIIKMAMSIASLFSFQDGDLAKSSDQQLLIAIREHIDDDYKHDGLTDAAISLVWNLSDKTVLVPVLLKTGYAKSVVEWIRLRETKFRDDKIDAPIHILHNLARHDDGIDELNSQHALQVIEDVTIDSRAVEDEDDLNIHLAMIRALLTDLLQIKEDGTKYSQQTLNMLLQLSVDAAKNEKHRYAGSHVSEPLTVLVKLFHNDEILHTLLCRSDIKPPSTTQSIIELFASLASHYYPRANRVNDLLDGYTCVVILNLFRLISGHEQYRQNMRNCEPFMEILDKATDEPPSFTDTFMPRTMKDIQQAASEILENLGTESERRDCF